MMDGPPYTPRRCGHWRAGVGRKRPGAALRCEAEAVRSMEPAESLGSERERGGGDARERAQLRAYLRRNLSTRPVVSMIFCVPV